MEHPLKSPARTMFGAGTLEELNREIPPFLHRILLVVGNHVVTGGLLARVREILDGRELVVGDGEAGPVTMKLHDTLSGIQRGEAGLEHPWVVHII